MKIDFLKIYTKGSDVLKSFPILNKYHNRMSQFILNWCRKHNFVRFDNLRAPYSTDDDIKKCSAVWFSVSAIFVFFTLYSLCLVCLLPCFICYAIGVINLEALKIVPKVDPEQVKQEMKARQEKQQEKIEKKEVLKKSSILWRIYSLFWTVFTFWVLYLLVVEPDKLKQWVSEYHLHDYIPPDWKIAEEDTYGIIAILLILGPALINALLIKLFAVFKLLLDRDKNVREL